MSTSIVATNDPLNSMPPRLTVSKPARVKATVYVPGLRSTTRYCPESFVTVDRVFSMRAGLEASTLTSGNAPPEASCTTPAIDACARAAPGSAAHATVKRTASRVTHRMRTSSDWHGHARDPYRWRG